MCILVNWETYQGTIKMKPFYVKLKTHINFNKKTDYKDTKFNIGDYTRNSKYKNIFAKGYVPNWFEEIFVIKIVKNTVPWTYLKEDLNGEEIIGTFSEKELQVKKTLGYKK